MAEAADLRPGDPPRGWRRVLLIGFMAAGKTTVGRGLADALGWEFADVDAELVRVSGVPVEEFFRSRGEAAFRAEEARLTAALCSRDRLVLATGGGWPGSGPGPLPASGWGSERAWSPEPQPSATQASTAAPNRLTDVPTSERARTAEPPRVAGSTSIVTWRPSRRQSVKLVFVGSPTSIARRFGVSVTTPSA